MTTNPFLVAFEAAAAAIPVGWGAPVDADGFGSDIGCTDDADALFAEVSSLRCAAESAWRTITSDRGSIPDAPGEGLDVRSYARKPATKAAPTSWAAEIRAELLRDDRFDDATVTITQASVDTWSIAIVITTAAGPFTLIGEFSASSAILQEILA